MEKIIGYKVVKGRRSFKPATEFALQRIRYKIDETTTRDIHEYGPFACFSTLEEAKNFYASYGDAILECEITYSVEDTLWKKNPPTFVKNRRGKGGYHAESGGITVKRNDLPNGTIFCDTVKPIKVIEVRK